MGIQQLTDAPTGCNVAQGQAVLCSISISPAAPANASFTFALTPRTSGVGAWTVRDANGKPGGGTGADITTSNGGTIQCVFVPVGATSVVFPITVKNSGIPDLDKTITATITGATNLTIGASSTTITIVNTNRTGIYDPVSYGATPNDATDDDAAAIQAAVNAAAAGGGKGVVSFGTAGTYDIRGANNGDVITIPPASGITITGYGSTIKNKGSICVGAVPAGYPGANVCAHRMLTTGVTYDGVGDTAPITLEGFTINGNRNGTGSGPWQNYDSEQAHNIFVGAAPFTNNAGRINFNVQDITDLNSFSDGVEQFTKVNLVGWHMTSTDDFRGGWVLTGGAGSTIVDGWDTYATTIYHTGIHMEIDGFGPNKLPSYVGPNWDVSAYVRWKNSTLDGAFTVGTVLPSWAGTCASILGGGPTRCGPPMDMVFDNIQMVSGYTVIGTFRDVDKVTITNSNLRFGVNDSSVNRAVFCAGQCNFTDSTITVDGSPALAGNNGTQGMDMYWQVGGYSPYNTGSVNLDHVSAVAVGGTNTCFIRQQNVRAGTALNIVSSGPFTGFSCGAPGYTGPANVSGGTGSPRATTTTALPVGQLACDGSAPVTTVPGATTTTTTIPATTTTVASTGTNRVQVEACTLGTDVIVGGGNVYGNNSVGTSTDITCSVNNAGAAGTKTMSIRYSDPADFIRLITVNGTDYPTSPGLTYTNSGNVMTTITNNVPLTVGANTIKFNVSYITVDWFEFDSTTVAATTTTAPAATTTTAAPATTLPTGCLRREFETSPTLVAWTQGMAIPGASGNAYIGDTNFAGSATYTVTVGTAGTYQLSTRSQTGGSGANRTLTVNGASMGNVSWPVANTWATAILGTYTLVAGANTIKVEWISTAGNGGALYLDYMDLCATFATGPTTIPPSTTAPPPTTAVTGRSVILSAFIDANSNGVMDAGETPMRRVRFTLTDTGTEQTIYSGSLPLGTAVTVQVPLTIGVRLNWYTPLTATTALSASVPLTGATVFSVGGCCPRAT